MTCSSPSESILQCRSSLASWWSCGTSCCPCPVALGGEEVLASASLHLFASLSPQLAGGAVMAVGIWTLAEKSDYISLLSSSTYSATAYILVVAGVVVMVTGILGCCATFKERRNLLRVVSFVYFIWGKHLGCVMLQPYLFGLEQISLRSPAPDSSVVHVPGDRFYCRTFSSIHTKNVLHDLSKKCNCNTYALCENIYLKQFKTNSYCFCLLLLPCPFYILFWKMGRGRKIGETCNKTSF